jgi:hypothetical protein
MITAAVIILLILVIILVVYYFWHKGRTTKTTTVTHLQQKQPFTQPEYSDAVIRDRKPYGDNRKHKPLVSANTREHKPHNEVSGSNREFRVRFDNDPMPNVICDGSVCKIVPKKSQPKCKIDPTSNSVVCDLESSASIAPFATSDNLTSEQSVFESSLKPANMSEENPEGEWGAAFNPQFVENQQKKFLRKLQRSHKHRAQSLKDLAKFHEQQDGMVEYAELINPAGKTIREVYENRTTGSNPRPKPKKVLHKGRNLTTYEADNEMNSGQLGGGLMAGNLDMDRRSGVNFGNDF